MHVPCSTGFAVVRSPSGHPVHIKIPELDDQSGKEKISNRPSQIKQPKTLWITNVNVLALRIRKLSRGMLRLRREAVATLRAGLSLRLIRLPMCGK